MDIAVVIGSYDQVGGIARVGRELYKRLAKRGYKITVFTMNKRLAGRKEITNGVEVRNYTHFSILNQLAVPAPSLARDLFRKEFDLVHIHGIHDLTTVFGYFGKRQSKVVVTPYYHGLEEIQSSALLWTLYRPLVARILSRADVIVNNSESVGRRLVLDFRIRAESMKVVYDGVDYSAIASASPLENEGRVILYVGRLEKYKNADYGIRVLNLLPKDFRYVVIGTGSYLRELALLATREGVSNRVVFLGHQPDDLVWRWLKTATVVLHLSSIESFGMTCIEALTAGTPVVANNDGLGLSETISLYPRQILGFDVKKEGLADLARQIIIASRLKPTNADTTRFSWERIAEEYDAIYRSLV